MEHTPSTYILDLVAAASSDLNTAFNEFVRTPEPSAGDAKKLGRQALFAINLESYQTAAFHAPRQTDRDFYGEGEGIILGRYAKGLDGIARNKLRVSDRPERSGVEDDGTVWLTLEPSLMEKDVIVRPPLYGPEDDVADPNLRMRLLIPERFRISVPEATMALNGLRAKLRQDEERRLSGQETVADGERRTNYGRALYVNRLRVRKSAPPTTPTSAAADEYRDAA